MAADLNTVIKQLTESSILAQGKLENFVPPKAHPATVDELIAELVKNNHLTPFQAAQVKAGKAKAIILGEYTILDKIGAGGMGQVFKAQHRRMKRIVAVKMLPPAMTKDAQALARFEREVEAAAKLSHQNIVAAYDAGQSGSAHFLVMEYVEGKDLSVMVKKDGPIPVGKAVNYILQAARGLEFAHSEGVVHRDIKPANLLLDKKGVVKILDMGLARIEGAGPAQNELTGTGTIMGTVDYMSPEQALNTKNADHRADIYSLGISLYYLLAGKSPYRGDSAMETLMAHQTQPIPSLQDTQTTVSKQLEAVFKKMVAKKIEDRYQSMSEVVEALERLGFGGSGTMNRGDVASTLDLSSADKKKLKASKKPLGSISNVVASEKSKNLLLKIVGGSFGTIIAPILVFYLIRQLDKQDKPAAPPAASVLAATVTPASSIGSPSVAVATNTPPQATSPIASGERPWETPAFQAWMKEVQALPAGRQAEAVSKKLVELNPGFDGGATPDLERGIVTGLNFATEHVTDISPVRALAGLQSLTCNAARNGDARSELWDLLPLKDMPLTSLKFSNTAVSDLTPLQDCKSLRVLNVSKTKVTPAQVAALQKALPNCQIEWEPSTGPGQAKGKLAYLDPAFQQWVEDTQQLPAEQQIKAVSKKLMELNPGFNGSVTGINKSLTPKIENGVVTEFGFLTDKVTDISPVRALVGLKVLKCVGSSSNMGRLADLSPLAGMPLSGLWFGNTEVSDLSPLEGMSLTSIAFLPQNITKGLEVVRQMKSLKTIGLRGDRDKFPAEEFWKKYAAGEFGKPAAPAKLAYLDAAFQTWVADTQKLPAGQQMEAVSKKLMELNPGFDGKVTGGDGKGTPKIQNGVVIEFGFITDNVTDISPVRVLRGLKGLWCYGDSSGKSRLADIAPLQGLPLESLSVINTPVCGLSSLNGMPLKRLYFQNTLVSDLLSLRGMKLTHLVCNGTPVSDLSSLGGMPLVSLSCEHTQVASLSPLRDCKNLGFLLIKQTRVTPVAVAALQKALPNCTIEWDDPTKATTPSADPAGKK